MILSPEDSPVRIRGVECKQVGLREYVGQKALDRTIAQMRMLLDEPFEWYLMNDADSMCVARDIPEYLYEDENILWSNVVEDWRENPHRNPHKLAFQPPYFAHRKVIKRMLTLEWVEADPVTPYVDWLMVVLAVETGTPFKSFPDGASFVGWRDGNHKGDDMMEQAALEGKIMLHSIKHQGVVGRVVRAHDKFLRSQ
jgi:hypothetical protein